MAKKSTVLIGVLYGVAALFAAVLWGSIAVGDRSFERNAKIIAAANAAREAKMTPGQRAARDAADEAVARAAKLEQARQELSESARGACLLMLKKSLHDPKSAEFGIVADWPASLDNDGRMRVIPTVRAKNGFGAYRLASYRCVVEPAGEGLVRVVSLDQID